MTNDKTQVFTLMKKFGGNVNSQNNIRKVEIVKNQKPIIKSSTIVQPPPASNPAPKPSNTSSSSTPVKKKGCNCNRRKS